VRLLGGALVTAVQANDGDAPAYEQGSSVSVHLPAESLRVLPEAPEPEEVDEEAAEAEREQAPPSAGDGAPAS
jgi:hypothetical protein